MKVLITAATAPELAIIRQYADNKEIIGVEWAVMGVGMLSTCYHLMQFFSNSKPSLVIQVGIAGTFTGLKNGTITVVEKEMYGDLGVEEGGIYKDVFDLGLANEANLFTNKALINPYNNLLNLTGLPKVAAVTVNEVSVAERRITQLTQKYHPDIESMEGLALHYVALQQNIPFLQVRGISNSIGDRNKQNWTIQPAIENYSNWLRVFLTQFGEQPDLLL